MKKIISIILSLVMILAFAGCGQKAAATWQEQYDLGVKYVNEAKYEEAILAFTKALEIDPKQAPVYIALAEVYVRQENYTAAAETLDKAITEIGETDELTVAKDKTARKEQGIPYVAEKIRSTSGIDDGSYTIYEYDESGRKLGYKMYDPDGNIYLYVVYKYDENGYVERTEFYIPPEELVGYEDYIPVEGTANTFRCARYSVGSDEPGIIYIRTFDENKREVFTEWYTGDGIKIYDYTTEYNSDGKVDRVSYYDGDTLVSYDAYNYEGGNLVVSFHNPDGSIAE